MSMPLSLSDFPRLPRLVRGTLVDGLATGIDDVAASGPASHRFLRHQWFAAALRAYGGRARTIMVTAADAPMLAMPLVPIGPAWAGLAAVPGSYWPFRSFPVGDLADDTIFDEALAVLCARYRGIRIGPVLDGDPAVAPLIAAARRKGWAAIDRPLAESMQFDLAHARSAGDWPRGSTLRKNRFHEKNLAAHGMLDWRMLDGQACAAAFDTFAAVEGQSWQSGSDTKFAGSTHGAFWRAAAEDPLLAAMFHAALLSVDGRPIAFEFDLDAGECRYAIANSYAPIHAKHSPGKLLAYRNLADPSARGITRIDWGAGDSGYKRIIGATEGPVIRDWLLLRPGAAALTGRLARAAWRRSGAAKIDAAAPPR